MAKLVDQIEHVGTLAPQLPGDEMTTKESIAALLTGGTYPFEVSKEVQAQAKDAGLIIIFGASDDLMEFRGAIHDEVECYNGGTALLDRKGLVQRDEDAEDEEIADYVIRKRTSRPVEAVWGKEGYSWIYRTEAPHATFEVVEDDDNYCRGIVIDIADLPAPPKERG